VSDRGPRTTSSWVSGTNGAAGGGYRRKEGRIGVDGTGCRGTCTTFTPVKCPYVSVVKQSKAAGSGGHFVQDCRPRLGTPSCRSRKAMVGRSGPRMRRESVKRLEKRPSMKGSRRYEQMSACHVARDRPPSPTLPRSSSARALPAASPAAAPSLAPETWARHAEREFRIRV